MRSKRSKTDASICAAPIMTAARELCAAAASSTSASSRALSIAARARRHVPPASAAAAALSPVRGSAMASGSTGLRAQRLGLLARGECVDKRIDCAVEHLVELMQRQVDAMVGDAGLGKVVGADALGAIAGTDHRAARRRDLGFLLGLGLLEQARAQNLEGPRLVLVLRFFVATDDHHAGWDVGYTYGRVGVIDALAARSRGAHHVDAEVLLFVDVDLDLVGLGHHGYSDSRGMDAPGGLGGGHSLHAMHSAFELEPAVGAAPGDERDHFLDSAKAGGAKTE